MPAAAWPAAITALKPQELWPTAEQSKLQFKLLQNASTSLNMLENASSSISSSLRLPFPLLLTLSLCLLPLRLLVPERLQLNRAFETTPQVLEAKTRVRPTCAPGLQGRGGGAASRDPIRLQRSPSNSSKKYTHFEQRMNKVLGGGRL